MTPALTAACLWVIAATATALLPIRRQYPPGIALLVAAPPLLWWITAANGPWLGVAAALAVLSLFRRPLVHLARRLVARPGNEDGAP